MKTISLLAAGLIATWTSTAAAYSPLIETTRAMLPEHPSFTVSVRSEKDGQLELVITTAKVDARKALEQAAAPKPADEPLDDFDQKKRIERAFRDLNSVVLYVRDDKSRKPLVLWGFAFTGITYKEPAKQLLEQLEGKAVESGEKRLTLSRESLHKAVIQFDCRKDGLLGPTYQVKLREYLDEDGQKWLKEQSPLELIREVLER